MKSGQHQTMKMQQKLSPQQLLLLQLIQMPVTELEQRLKEEVEKNPVLEVSSAASDVMEPLPESGNEGYDLMSIDTDDDDYSYRERQERDKNQDAHETVFVSEDSYFDHLMGQLSMRALTPRQYDIAQEIVGSLDDAGYVGRSLDLIANDLAFTQGIEVNPDEVEEVLHIIQQMDPPGIAARNLQECLSIQLHRSAEQTDDIRWATAIVDNCFEAFAAHNYRRVMEQLNLTEEQVDAAIARIRRLNPKPGTGDVDTSHARYIVPDFIVTRHDDQLTLTLNDRYLPQLQKSQDYHDMLQELQHIRKPSPSEQEALDFLRNNFDSADLLVDTLQQRHTSLLRVMRVILKKQYRFFLTGDTADLQPLLQKDVAAQTGYDISTVSRVVNSKYVQTEFGTFLLKECFSQAIVADDGQQVATEAVRRELKTLVDSEDKRNPLSDEALAVQLTQRGFPVARRTVAKYREMLGIPVGRLRPRHPGHDVERHERSRIPLVHNRPRRHRHGVRRVVPAVTRIFADMPHHKRTALDEDQSGSRILLGDTRHIVAAPVGVVIVPTRGGRLAIIAGTCGQQQSRCQHQ